MQVIERGNDEKNERFDIYAPIYAPADSSYTQMRAFLVALTRERLDGYIGAKSVRIIDNLSMPGPFTNDGYRYAGNLRNFLVSLAKHTLIGVAGAYQSGLSPRMALAEARAIVREAIDKYRKQGVGT